MRGKPAPSSPEHVEARSEATIVETVTCALAAAGHHVAKVGPVAYLRDPVRVDLKQFNIH